MVVEIVSKVVVGGVGTFWDWQHNYRRLNISGGVCCCEA